MKLILILLTAILLIPVIGQEADPFCDEANLRPHFDHINKVDLPYYDAAPFPDLTIAAHPKPQPVHKGIDLKVWHKAGDNFWVGGMAMLENGDMLEMDYNRIIYLVTGLDNAETVTRKELTGAIHTRALGIIILNNKDVYVADDKIVWSYTWDGTNLTDQEIILGAPGKSGYHGYNVDFVSDGTWLYTVLNTRGSISRYHLENKTWEHYYGSGFRNIDGMGMDLDGGIWFTDNQGLYRPGSPVFLLKEGKTYGVPTNDNTVGADYLLSQGKAGEPLPEPELEAFKNDMLWLPYDGIGHSITDIHFMKSGPFKGQPLIGDNVTGHVIRLMIDKVNGQKQGAALIFTGGMEGPIHRIEEDDKGNFYLGALGCCRNDWMWCGLKYGFQRMTFNNDFIGNINYIDILNTSLVQDGLVLEFTSDISDDFLSTANYRAYTFSYLKSVTNKGYGGLKIDSLEVGVLSIKKLSGRAIHLTIDGLLNESMLALEFKEKLTIDNNLQNHEMFYTMNHLSTRTAREIIPLSVENWTPAEMNFSRNGDILKVYGINGVSSNHRIMDVFGRAVSGLDLYTFSRTGVLDVSILEKGVYFLKMEVNNRTVVKNFVVH
jgi:hypothetical protein